MGIVPRRRGRRRAPDQSQPVSMPSPSVAPSPAISLDDGVVTCGASGLSLPAVGSSSPRSQPDSASSSSAGADGSSGRAAAAGTSGGGGIGIGYDTGTVIASCTETTTAAATAGSSGDPLADGDTVGSGGATAAISAEAGA